MSKTELRDALIEHYRPLFEDYHRFQNGDDEFEPTTAQLSILRPLNFILSDLNS